MKKIGKLVRDKIPQIIANNGEKPVFHTADPKEYHEKLLQKLQEEVDEFQESQSSEELADILEVVNALANEVGLDNQALEALRQKKARERGDFSKRIILDNVE